MVSNPNSSAVKGLNIAILVLAILGIICTIAMFAFGTVVVDYAAQSMANTTYSSDTIDDFKQIASSLRLLDENTIDEVSEDISKLSPSEFAKLTEAMDTGSDMRVLNVMETLGIGSNLPSDQQSAVAYLLSMTTAIDAADLANQISDMSTKSIGNLADDLEAYTGGSSSSSVSVNGVDVSGSTMSAIGMFTLVFLLVYFLIALVISLVASILGIRNCEKPDKLGAAFVFAIVGAVFAFLSGRIVSLVLHIIAAVKTHAVQKGNTPSSPSATDAPEPPSSDVYDYYAATPQDL